MPMEGHPVALVVFMEGHPVYHQQRGKGECDPGSEVCTEKNKTQLNTNTLSLFMEIV